MKNYDKHSPKWFKTNREEVMALPKQGHFYHALFEENLQAIRTHLKDNSIMDYTIRKLPEKKSRFDSAVLLCILKDNGEFMAKRHNNSQWLSLRY